MDKIAYTYRTEIHIDILTVKNRCDSNADEYDQMEIDLDRNKTIYGNE